MKRILLATVIVVGASQVATAQTSGSNSSNAPSVSNTAPKPTKNKKAGTIQPDSLDSRKIYNWKDGQRATPAGHEATSTNGGYSALGRDSAAAIRRDSTRQQ